MRWGIASFGGLDFTAYIPFLATVQRTGEIVIPLPSTMTVGHRYDVQMWWIGAGWPMWQTSNGLLMRSGPVR